MNKTFYKKSLKGGYIMILNTLLFIGIIMIILLGIANVTLSRLSSSKGFVASKQAYIATQSAAQEAMYMLARNININNVAVNLYPVSATATITTDGSFKKITSTADAFGYVRNLQLNMLRGTGISFHYAIQSGRGGFELRNSSSVTGNVFSNGTITGSGNFIRGEVVSASSTGLINNIHATGTVYSHTIQNSIIDKDAHYVNLTNTTVSGTKYPNSPDLPEVPLPITDEQIAGWEAIALGGGTATCTNGSYDITASTTIGPLKIPCNLNIIGTGGGFNVTIKGHIWVEGNITMTNKATIKMDPSLGNQNVAIIADNPAAPNTSGIISIGQNSLFENSGTAGSYVFMISQNKSSESGGSTDAISLNNGASALVAYAIHGQINLAQSVSVKEVTAYKIILSNSANVTYDTGLPSILFSTGPGGGYDVIDWIEI